MLIFLIHFRTLLVPLTQQFTLKVLQNVQQKTQYFAEMSAQACFSNDTGLELQLINFNTSIHILTRLEHIPLWISELLCFSIVP